MKTGVEYTISRKKINSAQRPSENQLLMSSDWRLLYYIIQRERPISDRKRSRRVIGSRKQPNAAAVRYLEIQESCS